MSRPEISQELLLQMKRDRELISQELPQLADLDARTYDAAAEDTLADNFAVRFMLVGDRYATLPVTPAWAERLR